MARVGDQIPLINGVVLEILDLLSASGISQPNGQNANELIDNEIERLYGFSPVRLWRRNRVSLPHKYFMRSSRTLAPSVPAALTPWN